jgi:superfamily II DNA or RNA helicase
MSKKLTTEEFIERAKQVHGDKYDYSKVEYKNSRTKVIIICPEHGEFLQTPGSHLKGQGCRKCSYKNYKYTTKEFIRKAKEIHGDRYDYSKVKYKNIFTKVIIICSKHGEYEQTPNSHLNGQGCSKCAGKYIPTTEEFIQEARKIHGNKYNYSKVDYKYSRLKVIIICPEHGEFKQTPNHHLRGIGCSACSKKKQYTSNSFIKKAKEVHGDKYNYSKIEYKNSKTKVTIICPEHGEFLQTPANHLNGQGCLKCYGRGLEWLTYDETKKIIQQFNIKTPDDYLKWWNKNKEWCQKMGIMRNLERYYKKNKNMSTDVTIKEQESQNEGSWISWADFLGTAGNGGRWTKKTLLNFLHQYRDQIIMAESSELLILLTNAGLEHKLDTHEKFKKIILNEEGSEERESAYNEMVKELDSEVEREGDDESLDDDDSVIELDDEDDINIDEADVTGEIDIQENDESIKLPSEKILEGFKLYDHEYIHLENLDQEKIQFLIQNRINKLWNIFLNDRITISDIKNDNFDGKYFTEIKNTFLDEYEKVSAIKNPKGYCFKYQPMMMQKLVSYRLKENKIYGNWSTVGAGKTLASVYAGRYVDAKNTIIVTYNSTVEGWVESLHSYFNDCTVYKKTLKNIKFEEGKNNYVVLNYEFFQQGDRAESRLYEFMQENRIDYVILDEVHSVKQRKEDTKLTLDQMLEQGLLSSRRRLMMKFLNDIREKNPDIYFNIMTATPIINNLVEAKKLMEMLHGEKYNELSTHNRSVKAGLEFHKHVVINGIRYQHVPRNKNGEVIKRNRIEFDIDGSDLLGRLENVSNDLLIEQITLEKKLVGIHPYIRKGSMIFTYFVEGIVDEIKEYCENLGFKCGLYTGRQSTSERETVKKAFQNGKIDIIIGSLPIGTGVDGFQEVCDRLICMSLPWTHSEYEQLVGRVQREGSPHSSIDVIIPKVVVNYVDNDGESKSWSRDRHRLNVIKFKKDLFSIVVSGIIPDGIVTDLDSIRKKSIKSLNQIIEKIKSGEITIENRDELEKEFLEHKEIDEYRKKISEFGEHNMKWNTRNSSTSFDIIKNNPKEWHDYHKAYRQVCEGWDELPYKVIAEKINKLNKPHLIIGDFGCGDNLFSKEIPNEVKAFDMYAIDDTVIVADITNLPLEDNTLHIGIFSLSLMGRNYKDAIREAKRVITDGGRLFISEPLNRWESRENGFEELGTEISAEGFEVMDIYVQNGFVFVYAINAL